MFTHQLLPAPSSIATEKRHRLIFRKIFSTGKTFPSFPIKTVDLFHESRNGV
jgi:hypothetical protein